MIDQKIKFRNSDGDEKCGTVMDKVLVLIVGTSSNFHNYVVQEFRNGKIHIINPLNIVEVIN